MQIRESLAELSSEPLHASLTAASMESMNLLNNIAGAYPSAVSFAAGRPYEGFFDTDQLFTYLKVFTGYLRDTRGMTEQQIARTLFQYGDTKGVINELIARHLAVDEGVDADPGAIVVTVGFQEALFLVLRALRADDRDTLLAPSPTYVGLTGAAQLTDLPVLPVPSGDGGLDLDELVRLLRTARHAGRRVRACYVTPDFANPVGVSMSVPDRHRLLEIAAAEGLLLLEDNPYGIFHRTPDRRPPTLKSLDPHGRVVYLGSFAKSGVAGARVGFAVADQPMPDGTLLADQLSKIKSMLTVNTSPVAQAVIGGKLIAHDYSLVAANTAETAVYRANLGQVLTGLGARLGTVPGVSWNEPDGGFFVVVTVPFTVDDPFLEHTARTHGVLFTPMHHFYGDGTVSRQLRLSISTLTPDRIEEGLDRLAAAVTDRIAADRASGVAVPTGAAS
ncbi:PLP-dependent aminotransferase family protein [Streptomyces sp. NPDC048290]|uniref:aminotransferase-like domain-containing protein n=1 Tax=Streptomyces sp. NPDC048290 TaxID=3155811 RepID=UPI00343B2BF7